MLYDLSTEKNWVRLINSSLMMIYLFLHTFSTSSASLSLDIYSLSLLCECKNRGLYPVSQGFCPSLTGFLTFPGNLKNGIWTQLNKPTMICLPLSVHIHLWDILTSECEGSFMPISLLCDISKLLHVVPPMHLFPFCTFVLFSFPSRRDLFL